MQRSLRARLLAIVILGACGLALVNALIGMWTLAEVRDSAIDDGAQMMRHATELHLRRTAADRAQQLDQTLSAVRQLTTSAGTFLSRSPATGSESLVATATDAVATASMPRPKLAAETASVHEISGQLDALLPSLTRSLPQISRASFLPVAGLPQTFPPLDTKALANWDAERVNLAQISAPQNNPVRLTIWTEVRRSLDGDDQVLSAVAPVYRPGGFAGALVMDVSLAQITSDLDRLELDQGGFAILIDAHGRLLAASQSGERQLRLSSGADRSAADLVSLRQAMQAGDNQTTLIELGGHPYMLAYAPVPSVGWSLGLAAPADAMAADANASSVRISQITERTGSLGLLALGGTLVLMTLVLSGVLRQQFVQPLATLTDAARALASGTQARIPVRRNDEIGRLAATFNAMTDAIDQSRSDLIAANQHLELTVKERTADLELAVGRMEQLFKSQQSLLRTLREVATPVIPVARGVLTMPLIGQFDSERAQNATRDLLQRIERERAKTVLLDVTGLPIIDTQVARSLLNTVAAARLLGARVVLVGVMPEVAQTLVALGIDLSGIETAPDVQTAIEGLARRDARG